MRKFSLLLLGCLLCAANGWAATTAPIEVELTQADTGEAFWARPKGNEYVNWMETAEGYSIVEQGGVWFYAEQDSQGELVPSSIRVAPTGAKSALSFEKHLRPPLDPSIVEHHVLRPLHRTSQKSLTHTQPVLVILVDFSDISFDAANTDASFQSLIFGASASVKDFYLENTYGSFTLSPAAESYGTANDGIVHVAMGTTHPNAGDTFSTWSSSAGSYISAANSVVNFSSFDTNGNGTLTSDELSIVLILAGYENSFGGAASLTPRAWGHKSSLSPSIVLDTKTLSPYTLFGERHATSLANEHQATIGIMCHELGHLMLGLPDLYDIDGGSEGIGEWGLMGSGSWNTSGAESGDSPAHMDAWCKVILDMTTPADVNSAGNDLSILEGSANASIRRISLDEYKSPFSEYFLVENRQLSGYDVGLPGAGLLIFHVDGEKTSNADETHKWVDLEEADAAGHLDSQTNRGDTGDPFPGSSVNTTFNGASSPNSDDYNGADTGVAVTDISASGASMTVDVTPPSGNHYDSVTYAEVSNVADRGWGTSVSTTIWTALKVNNDTSMDTLDGVDVFINDTSATVDFRLYSTMPADVPTTLLHTQTGFAATAGWNRLLLTTPQSFPTAADRVIVLKIVAATQTFPAASDGSGINSARCYVDADGAGAFFNISEDLNQVALLSLSTPILPVADFSSVSYSVSEGTANATITVDLDIAPATTCSVHYTTTAGTATATDDFTTTSGDLTFTSSDTSLTFDVPIIDDGTIEGSETFTVTLSAPVDCTLAGTNNPATVTITSNDTPSATVYVNFSWTGGESGTVSNPYNTFSEGLAGVSSGGTINLNGTAADTESSYTGTISSAVTLTSSPAGGVSLGVTGAGSK